MAALQLPAKQQLAVGDIASGLICGLMCLVMAIGNANLLFAGPLHRFLAAGVGLCIFSAGMLAFVSMLTSSVKGALSTPQSASIAATAIGVQPVAASMGAAAPSTVLATTVVAIFITTALVGLALLLLGSFRFGGLVRFAPYPVVGGFLAGTGWLVLLGGLGIVVGTPLRLDHLGPLVEPANLAKLATAIGLIGAVVLLQTRVTSSLVLPAVVLIALVVFNLATPLLGISGQTLRETGWLAPFADSHIWPPLSSDELDNIDLPALLRMIAGTPIIMAVTILNLLMNLTALEISRHTDINLDRELRSAGWANLFSAAGGGPPGHLSLSVTMLAERLGGNGTVVAAIAAIVCLVALLLGETVLRTVAIPVLGGLMMWFGVGLLRDWLVRTAQRFSLFEYLTLLFIFAVVVFVGFAWGVVVGTLAAVVLFAFEYSRVDSIRHMLSGQDYHSSFEQTEERRQALRRHGAAILIIRLHGYLFFGTADRLRRSIQQRIARGRIGFLLIDFTRVTGLESSTVLSFIRLGQFAEREGFIVYFTAVPDQIRGAMMRGGLSFGPGGSMRLGSHLDGVLEQCENQLLADTDNTVLRPVDRPIADRLGALVPEAGLAGALKERFTRVALAPGDLLVEEGSASDDIFVIEAGRASITIAGENGHRVRLAGVGPGALVGEIAFYLGTPRTASIVADTDIVAWRLSRASLAALETDSPALVAHFHKGLAAILADRLAATDRLVRFLAD